MSREKKPISASQDLIREADGIVDTFAEFTDGYRVLFLIQRAKEGSQSPNNDKVTKYISKDKTEFRLCLIRLLQEMKSYDTPLRIYSSLNERDIEKGIRKFKQDQLEADYYDTESRHSFYTDTKNRFVSALMVPASRKSTLFMFDCDSVKEQEESLIKLAELGIDIVRMYPTKNGWHIITKPFNPNLFQVENVSISKDGLILLKW